MHSGLLIFLWLTSVAILQFLEPEYLLVAVVLCAASAALFASTRCWRLVRRIRFLLLAIVILFAGFTPGEAVFIDWPGLSPSWEGVNLAAEHAGRVLAVVFCVAVLMELLPAQRLVGGLYALVQPFRRVGFPAHRVAVRTLLVLEYVDSDEKVSWKTWLMEEPGQTHASIQIPAEHFGPIDAAVLLLALLGLLLAGLTR
jgi:energy-coupling factor transporter transmembrane protein EcfT